MKDNQEKEITKSTCIHFLFHRFNKGRLEGTCGNIFTLMESLMNFKYSAIPSIDGFYGNKVKDNAF